MSRWIKQDIPVWVDKGSLVVVWEGLNGEAWVGRLGVTGAGVVEGCALVVEGPADFGVIFDGVWLVGTISGLTGEAGVTTAVQNKNAIVGFRNHQELH